MSNYEIQVLESYGTNPADMKNPNYADGQAGAVYAENPPMVNPARKPGQWQVYDIIFHQPVWEGLRMVHPGSVTVLFNGVVVQDHWEMEGLTTHKVRRPLAPHAAKLPLFFQDHGCEVHFRNIWIREIPSRYANVTHGGPGADENAVMALRRKTAAKLFAKIEKPVKPTIENMEALAEVIGYAREGAYEKTWKETAVAFHGVLDKMTDAEWTALLNKDNFDWAPKTETDTKGNVILLGYTVTSKVAGYEGNSIFLPAAGYRNETDLDHAGSYGNYWSSSLYEDGSVSARYVYFNSEGVGRSRNSRYYGFSVRPVSD